ncbi:MAG: sigma-54-dependent Fis family transcriptional regulator [Planctomycetota bacterium]|nr:MAG: sigma-54-dependent Fis family transcriptional regulator [Planctomycetota bacterium]
MQASVLVVDDNEPARMSVADILRRAGYEVDECSSGAEALKRVDQREYDCIVTDLRMPGMSGVELVKRLQPRRLRTQIIMATAYASVSTAVEAMRYGAFDYIEKPFDADVLERLVGDAVRRARFIAGERIDHTDDPARPPVMIGESEPMQTLRRRLAQVAPTPETVLICGESGTGKELVARTIHAMSGRAGGPFVSLNCPVLSAHLMESELFGHEKGAFTGAETSRVGRFELADGGSILLDEITEIELPLQAKLLRVLQEKSFERVGSSETKHVDVRVLATTNRNLEEEVEAGRFRQDLYYRLAVLPLVVPPLRERKEDIPLLVDHFLDRSAARLGKRVELDDGALALLMEYDWPGNVRELENIVTRAAVMSTDDSIGADQLARWLRPGRETSASAENEPVVVAGMSLQEMERRLIEATLEKFDGHREKTAKALGIGVRTLTSKLRQYGYAPRAKRPAKVA